MGNWLPLLAFALEALVLIVGIGFFMGKLKSAVQNSSDVFSAEMRVLSATLAGNKELLTGQISDLAKKQEKYNNIQERVVVAEQSTKSAHNRMDVIEVDFKACQQSRMVK